MLGAARTWRTLDPIMVAEGYAQWEDCLSHSLEAHLQNIVFSKGLLIEVKLSPTSLSL